MNGLFRAWKSFCLFLLAAILWHKDSLLPCPEKSYYRRHCVIKNQSKARNYLLGFWMPDGMVSLSILSGPCICVPWKYEDIKTQTSQNVVYNLIDFTGRESRCYLAN